MKKPIEICLQVVAAAARWRTQVLMRVASDDGGRSTWVVCWNQVVDASDAADLRRRYDDEQSDCDDDDGGGADGGPAPPPPPPPPLPLPVEELEKRERASRHRLSVGGGDPRRPTTTTTTLPPPRRGSSDPAGVGEFETRCTLGGETDDKGSSDLRSGCQMPDTVSAGGDGCELAVEPPSSGSGDAPDEELGETVEVPCTTAVAPCPPTSHGHPLPALYTWPEEMDADWSKGTEWNSDNDFTLSEALCVSSARHDDIEASDRDDKSYGGSLILPWFPPAAAAAPVVETVPATGATVCSFCGDGTAVWTTPSPPMKQRRDVQQWRHSSGGSSCGFGAACICHQSCCRRPAVASRAAGALGVRAPIRAPVSRATDDDVWSRDLPTLSAHEVDAWLDRLQERAGGGGCDEASLYCATCAGWLPQSDADRFRVTSRLTML